MTNRFHIRFLSVTFWLLVLPVFLIAKPKVSKEIKAQAAQMVKDGWEYKPISGLTLEEALTDIAERKANIDASKERNGDVIVTVTTEAASLEIARKKAMMAANREAGLMRTANVEGSDMTSMKMTNDSSNIRTLSSYDVSTRQKVGKNTVLLEATRKHGNAIELMIVVMCSAFLMEN